MSEPRSATLYLTPAIALLASFALVNIFTWMGESGISESDPKKDTPIKGAAMAVLFLVLFGQWIYSAFTTTLMLSSNTLLSQEDRTAYKWIAQNTPADSRFLVISGKSPLTDQISEWFPALTGRQSVATVQGYEWLSDYNFDTVLEQAQSVQNCYFQDYSCITNWLKYTNKTAEYIYLHNPSFTEGASGQTKYQYSTMNFYDKQNSLVEIYHQGSVVIYRIPESSN